MCSKSFVWLSAFVAILFTIGVAPYLTQNAFADVAIINGFTVDDPDNGDRVYSIGDTITITFDIATNQTGVVTDANVAGNFTFTNQNINDNTFSGTWTTNQILTLTVNAITTSPIIGTTGITALAGNNIGVLGENNEDNTHNAEGTDFKLTGDFGLFVAVTTGGGSGCNGDCTEPTLGVLNDGRRIVDNGFSYNGKSVDVEYYFTPYPLVTVQVGKQNVAEFKIYENQGVDNIRHFELAFGLANGESIGMSKAVINWDKTFDGIETVTTDDPENVLDKVKVTTSEGYCSDTMQTKCLIVKVVHTFRAPLDFNILGTNVWDTKRNAWNNYFNHGIEVVGESLNPPKEYEVTDKRQLYHLTETGKTSAVDEFGNSWSLEYGLWAKDYIPNKKIIDEIQMNGYPREHAKFNMYKYGQFLIAEDRLYEMCSECSDESYAEINDVFTYEYPKLMSSLKNSDVQKRMIFEAQKAQIILDHIFDPILHLK